MFPFAIFSLLISLSGMVVRARIHYIIVVEVFLNVYRVNNTKKVVLALMCGIIDLIGSNHFNLLSHLYFSFYSFFHSLLFSYFLRNGRFNVGAIYSDFRFFFALC